MSDVRLLSLFGEIDIARRQWIEEELDQIKSFSVGTTTIVDLSDVRYLDTTFLTALARVGSYLERELPTNHIRIVAPERSFVRRILRITDFDEAFQTFDNLGSAQPGRKLAIVPDPT